MKKLLLLLLLNVVICSGLLAQVSVGVKAGGALVNNTYEGIGLFNEGSNSIKPSYLAGLFASMPLSEDFGFQLEVLYSNKGFRVDEIQFARHHNLHYLNVPIMLQYRVLDKLTVELGPEIGYLMDATTNRSYTISLSGSPSYEEQLLSSYKDLDVALNIGVGYSFSDRWLINLRYNLGLYDISEDFTVSVFSQEEPVLISGSTYNRSLQLSVGYRIF